MHLGKRACSVSTKMLLSGIENRPLRKRWKNAVWLAVSLVGHGDTASEYFLLQKKHLKRFHYAALK